MIAAHMNQIDSRLPRIGVIRKGDVKGDKAPGKDLDYFRLDRAERSVMEAWEAVLGQEPRAISGVLPYADPAENLSIWDELWQGKRLLWRGDGERLHVQLQGNAYVRYAPGQGPAQPAAAGQKVDSGKVARISRLRLMLPQLRVAGIFEIASTSRIDADELWSNLMWIGQTVPTLQRAPVTVFRAARQFNVAQPNGSTMAVTKHMLHMMLDGRYIDSLLPVGGGLLPAPPIVPTLPSGLDDTEDGLFDDDDDIAPQQSRHPVNQPVVVAPLPEDEVVIHGTAGAQFIDTAAMLLDADPDDLKVRMKALGYTSVPGHRDNRLDIYRKLKAQGPAKQPELVQVAAANGAYTE